MRYVYAAIAIGFGLAACESRPASGDAGTVEIAALDWLSETANPVEHLTLQPVTCLSKPKDPAVQRGALLFASPLLLGGQAAKAGLSCAACHRNGRGNPDFVFQSISGAPGTADVTHGLFSVQRADQIFNPVEIPDLARPQGQSRVDRNTAGVLEAFLTAQIVEEFSGTVPQRAVVEDLAAYIRALDDRVCAPDEQEAQTWRIEIVHIRAGLQAGQPLSDAYVDATRSALGRLHNRFPGANQASLRADLIAMSRALTEEFDEVELTSLLDALVHQLDAADEQSLYNPAVLGKALP